MFLILEPLAPVLAFFQDGVPDNLQGAGILGILAMLLFKEVMTQVSKRKEANGTGSANGSAKFTADDRRMIRDLWAWHAPVDGRQDWKGNQEVLLELRRITTALERLVSFAEAKHQ